MAIAILRKPVPLLTSARLLGPTLLIALSISTLISTALLVRQQRRTSTNSEARQATSAEPLPRLLIYRRSHKTGSTSMAAALLEIVEPLGYVGIQLASSEAGTTRLFTNLHIPRGRPVFLFSHNAVTRDVTTRPDVVIMDTFRDGYEQITSFCRAKRRVASCDEALANCVANDSVTLRHLYYRWAGREEEDDDTFIDVPLSSQYPALSTTALRTVFPHAVLHIDHYRKKNSTCPEVPSLRAIYQQRFAALDQQVDKLSRRLLIIAGYPHEVVNGEQNTLTLSEMLDMAEDMERLKYNLAPPRKAGLRSFAIEKAAAETGAWSKSRDGKWFIVPSANLNSFNRQKSKYGRRQGQDLTHDDVDDDDSDVVDDDDADDDAW